VRGFTLIEVMVALVIMAVALTTLLATHVMSTRDYAEAKAMTISSLLAEQKLAELQAAEEPPEPGEQSGIFEDNENYRWVLTVNETSLEELRELILEVSLLPPEGDEEPPRLGGVTVVTYLAKCAEEKEEEEEQKSAPTAG
jgi:general secretion pathway protein I